MKFDYQHDVIQWLDVIVDMKNVRDYKNFLDLQDTDMQPQNNLYLNDLYELNQIYMKQLKMISCATTRGTTSQLKY